MPMFLGTSFMVSKTPIFNIDANNSQNVALTNRLQTFEESINSFMAFSSDRTVITSANNTLIKVMILFVTYVEKTKTKTQGNSEGENIRLLSYNSRGFGLVAQQFC